MLFLLGYLLHTEDIHIRYKPVIFAVIFAAASVCSIWISQKTGIPNHDIFAEFSPVTAVLASLILLGCRDGIKAGGAIAGGSAYIVRFGIAVYLMHPVFLGLFRDKPGIRTILFGTLVWAASTSIACLLDRIPVLRKIFLQ